MFTIDEQLLFLIVSLIRLPITYTNRATRTSIGSYLSMIQHGKFTNDRYVEYHFNSHFT